MRLDVQFPSFYLDTAVGYCSLRLFSPPLRRGRLMHLHQSVWAPWNKMLIPLVASESQMRSDHWRTCSNFARCWGLLGPSAGVEDSTCVEQQGCELCMTPAWESSAASLNNLCAAHWTGLNSLLALQKRTPLCSVHRSRRHACGAATAPGKQGHGCEGKDWESFLTYLWDWILRHALDAFLCTSNEWWTQRKTSSGQSSLGFQWAGGCQPAEWALLTFCRRDCVELKTAKICCSWKYAQQICFWIHECLMSPPSQYLWIWVQIRFHFHRNCGYCLNIISLYSFQRNVRNHVSNG